jgi:hypothetical protein
VDTLDRFAIIPPRPDPTVSIPVTTLVIRLTTGVRRGVSTMAWLGNRPWIEGEERPIYNQDNEDPEDDDLDDDEDLDEDDDFEDDDDFDEEDLEDDDEEDEDEDE